MNSLEELSAEDFPIHGLWSEELPEHAAASNCVGSAGSMGSASCPASTLSSQSTASCH